jgi:hypothetical protein
MMSLLPLFFQAVILSLPLSSTPCPAQSSLVLINKSVPVLMILVANYEKALNSFLKLPVAGYRAHDDHRVNGIGAARL